MKFGPGLGNVREAQGWAHPEAGTPRGARPPPPRRKGFLWGERGWEIPRGGIEDGNSLPVAPRFNIVGREDDAFLLVYLPTAP